MKTLLNYMLAAVAAVTISLIAANSTYAGEHEVSVGLFTEHLMNDKSTYNETDNQFIMYQYKNQDGYTIGGGTFKNSHFARSHVAGVGREWLDSVGVYFAAVHGYEGYMKTHYKGLIFVPIFYAKTWNLKHTMFGHVYNLSYSFKF